MGKRAFHIIILAALALNLTGAATFAYPADCGMECCGIAERDGSTSFEAPTCCGMDGVTCGFETGHFDDLFDDALCSWNNGHWKSYGTDILSFAGSSHSPTPGPAHIITFDPTGSPPTVPIYLTNVTILC